MRKSHGACSSTRIRLTTRPVASRWSRSDLAETSPQGLLSAPAVLYALKLHRRGSLGALRSMDPGRLAHQCHGRQRLGTGRKSCIRSLLQAFFSSRVGSGRGWKPAADPRIPSDSNPPARVSHKQRSFRVPKGGSWFGVWRPFCVDSNYDVDTHENHT